MSILTRNGASLIAMAVAAALTLSGAIAVPMPAHAEGSIEDGSAPAKHKRSRPKAKAKPAPKAAAVKPAGPIPYTALTPDIERALTPEAVPPAHAMTTDALPQPAETNRAIPPASDVAIAPKTAMGSPPPPAVPRQAPTVGAPAEISLRCETTVTQGKKTVSGGVFFIDLFPSAVFPDAHADFKFLFVDPAHKSLIRDSICIDTLCPAEVTGSAYYLVNQTTRHGSALRITLDRSRGAFYAEEIDQGVMGLFRKSDNAEHLGEQGICVPQTLPNALF